MNTAVITLLQITATFLLGVQRNPNASLAAQQQAISIANQVIQLSIQDLGTPSIPVPQNNSTAPNITGVLNALYLNAHGQWVRLGQGVEAISSSTSFGDLNGDGIDDAVILVRRAMPDGSMAFSLAALLNQGGTLFNIADTPLGNSIQVYSHDILRGEFVIDMQIDNQARSIRHYTLLGSVFGETQ